MKRLVAIKRFLDQKEIPFDIPDLEEMEIQINVGQDGGTRVQRTFHLTNPETGEDREISWYGYTNCGNPNHGSGETWKSFRIPYAAKEANKANYSDKELKFSTDHFEAIGLSGWNWVKKQSEWVGFDFDSIANHTQGLTNEELNGIRQSIEGIDWITCRKSTSGKGLHFYIYFSPPVPTNSHTEHAALARSVLSIVSARIGKSLEAKVDVCGGILWIWHRKRSADAFCVMKSGSTLSDIPVNWRDHTDVVSGKRKRIRPPVVTEADEFYLEDLLQKTRIADLDDGHRQVIGWLLSNNKLAWWDQDRKLLVAHTHDMQECHIALRLKGPFYTTATGKETGHDQNCFAFPLRNSGWVIRRHTRKTAEHPSWTVDPTGWTRCYYNVPADLATAARCHEGIERTDGRFELPTLINALKALRDLGAIEQQIAEELETNPFLTRPALLKQHKDGRAVVSVQKGGSDKPPSGWYEGVKGYWEKIITIQNEAPEIEVPDNFVRHLVVGGKDAGWCIYTRGQWIFESDINVRRAMIAGGTATSPKHVEEIRGQCVLHPWYITNRPFQPEYPGNRAWNRNAPQFAFEALKPALAGNLQISGIGKREETEFERTCPTWSRILSHLGEGLNDAVENNKWCQQQGVRYGKEYLFLWLASLVQHPTESLPYLFFYSTEQNTGKSTFHEAISLLFKESIGYVRADVSLTSNNRFNGELASAVLCVVEETHLGHIGRGQKEAYNRIKDWVTSPTILIHEKGRTPYQMPNTTHWIQCANDIDACPIFPGDTRIVLIRVYPFEECGCPIVPEKKYLMSSLELEGAVFLWWLLNTEIPKTDSRLRVPSISSAEKLEMMFANEPPIKAFFRERIYEVQGQTVKMETLYEAFLDWLPIERRRQWSRTMFYRSLPNDLLRGKYGSGQYYAANISLQKDAPIKMKLIKIHDHIVEDV